MIDRKSQGIHQDEWMRRVEELSAERQTLFPLEFKQLKHLFDQDWNEELFGVAFHQQHAFGEE